jgi:hypothetical protein
MSVLRASGFALLALSAAACSNLPGEALGTYKVTMALEENSCGANAIHSLDGKRYAVQVRSEGTHAYWRIPGQPPVQGKYAAPKFAFEFGAVVASSGPDSGPHGCRLTQLDQLTGSVLYPADQHVLDGGGDDEVMDAGTDEDDTEGQSEEEAPDDESDDEKASGALDAGALPSTGLVGEHLMTIAAQPGTDCQHDALMPNGAFERLPCSVRYKLIGVPTKPF